MGTALSIIAFIAFVAILLSPLYVNNPTPEEQAKDDDEQAEYLTKIRNAK